jgi:hypothetical protein
MTVSLKAITPLRTKLTLSFENGSDKNTKHPANIKHSAAEFNFA